MSTGLPGRDRELAALRAWLAAAVAGHGRLVLVVLTENDDWRVSGYDRR